MIEFEDGCVGCPREMGCLGRACPDRKIPRMYCDECGEECSQLYWLDGEQYCADCVIDKLEKVDVNEVEDE